MDRLGGLDVCILVWGHGPLGAAPPPSAPKTKTRISQSLRQIVNLRSMGVWEATRWPFPGLFLSRCGVPGDNESWWPHPLLPLVTSPSLGVVAGLCLIVASSVGEHFSFGTGKGTRPNLHIVRVVLRMLPNAAALQSMGAERVRSKLGASDKQGLISYQARNYKKDPDAAIAVLEQDFVTGELPLEQRRSPSGMKEGGKRALKRARDDVTVMDGLLGEADAKAALHVHQMAALKLILKSLPAVEKHDELVGGDEQVLKVVEVLLELIEEYREGKERSAESAGLLKDAEEQVLRLGRKCGALQRGGDRLKKRGRKARVLADDAQQSMSLADEERDEAEAGQHETVMQLARLRERMDAPPPPPLPTGGGGKQLFNGKEDGAYNYRVRLCIIKMLEDGLSGRKCALAIAQVLMAAGVAFRQKDLPSSDFCNRMAGEMKFLSLAQVARFAADSQSLGWSADGTEKKGRKLLAGLVTLSGGVGPNGLQKRPTSMAVGVSGAASGTARDSANEYIHMLDELQAVGVKTGARVEGLGPAWFSVGGRGGGRGPGAGAMGDHAGAEGATLALLCEKGRMDRVQQDPNGFGQLQLREQMEQATIEAHGCVQVRPR